MHVRTNSLWRQRQGLFRTPSPAALVLAPIVLLSTRQRSILRATRVISEGHPPVKPGTHELMQTSCVHLLADGSQYCCDQLGFVREATTPSRSLVSSVTLLECVSQLSTPDQVQYQTLSQ